MLHFQAIREKYELVPLEEEIYLYLDNAGGHGKKEVVETYVSNLERDHNVICVHQRPRSPESNMLDLGVWMAFQNVVEKQHVGYLRDANCLATTVDMAWKDLNPMKLENV